MEIQKLNLEEIYITRKQLAELLNVKKGLVRNIEINNNDSIIAILIERNYEDKKLIKEVIKNGRD